MLRTANRLQIFDCLQEDSMAARILNKLQPMMREHNKLIEVFDQHITRIKEQARNDPQAVLILKANENERGEERLYNLPADNVFAGIQTAEVAIS